MGALGLSFETWDPQQIPPVTGRTYRFSIAVYLTG